MSHAEVLTPKMTPDEFLAWDETQEERHEFVDGVIRGMSGGSLSHSRIVRNLTSITDRLLNNTPCESLTSTHRVQSKAAASYFYPDIVIVCDEPEIGRGDAILNPLVVFEVLSPSTEKYDRFEKFWLYQKIASLQEYFLVHQDTALAEAFRRVKDSETWEVYTHCVYVGLDAILEVESAGISFPLRDIYRRVELAEAEIKGEEEE